MKPDIVESMYPLGLGQVISSVTRHQRRTANPSLRTLRDHHGPRHRYHHVLTLYAQPYAHSSPQPLPLQRTHSRPETQKISCDMASQWTDQGQYLSPQLYSDRLDVLFNANRP